jgi:hypothetical protein
MNLKKQKKNKIFLLNLGSIQFINHLFISNTNQNRAPLQCNLLIVSGGRKIVDTQQNAKAFLKSRDRNMRRTYSYSSAALATSQK